MFRGDSCDGKLTWYLFGSRDVGTEPRQHGGVGPLADYLDGAVFGPYDDTHALSIARETQHVKHLGDSEDTQDNGKNRGKNPIK